MPDDLGAALTPSDDGDNPIRRVDGAEQIVIRMEDLVAEVGASPRREIRQETGSEHDVLRADGPASDLHRKGVLPQSDLTHFRAKFDVGQPAGHPLQVLIEFLATAPNLRAVDKPIEPPMGAKE